MDPMGYEVLRVFRNVGGVWTHRCQQSNPILPPRYWGCSRYSSSWTPTFGFVSGAFLWILGLEFLVRRKTTWLGPSLKLKASLPLKMGGPVEKEIPITVNHHFRGYVFVSGSVKLADVFFLEQWWWWCVFTSLQRGHVLRCFKNIS